MGILGHCGIPFDYKRRTMAKEEKEWINPQGELGILVNITVDDRHL
jgi:hypothetical protein